jgi:hypothetical protein
MFPLGVPEHLEDEANKWYSDYIELMEYRKNPIRGKEKCDGCLLSMGKEEAAIYVGINKIMAKGLEDSSNSADQPLYPCKIQNRFECPYEKEKRKPNAGFDVDDLCALDDIADLVEQAFSHVESMTESNDTVYETNFETGRVREIRTNYYGSPYLSPIDYPLEEKLAEVKKLSIVPIRSAQDTYHGLTDRETLDKVLEQGLDEDDLKYKDYLLNFFMSIKDKVKIEDLFIAPNDPTAKNTNRQQQYAKCSLCQGFANIYCVNCNNIWLCNDHWKQHKIDYHVQKEKQP